MNRIVLAFLLGLAIVSTAKASSAEDIQFEQYVEASKSQLEKGMSIIADKQYRVIVLTMPLAVNFSDVTADVLKAMRDEAIKAMRSETADVRIIKALKINIVYNFLTIDKKIVCLAVSYQDL